MYINKVLGFLFDQVVVVFSLRTLLIKGKRERMDSLARSISVET